MGNYVQSSLIKDEKIVYEAQIHWFIFIAPVLLLLIAALFFVGHDPLASVGSLFLLIGIYKLIWALAIKSTTELALTNKRVISKFGFIKRFTMDTNLGKIEGVTFHQGIFGRMLRYGSVVIRGTGGDPQTIPYIADPTSFKNAVNNAIDGI
jgi:uncharacterized membrane protein YdbT with pleckstrin-like domain